MKKNLFSGILPLILTLMPAACGTSADDSRFKPRYLVPDDYMADPAARVFNGRLYVYPSHDRDTDGYLGNKDNGGEYDMVDYHVFSLDDVAHGDVTDHGVVLALSDIPWAHGQLWDNDVAHKDGRYYMYFPAKDPDGIFRIGVAIASRPEGPFVPQAEPMHGSYSIDPCVLEDDGSYYMYFGGLWGGQLQLYNDNTYEYAPERMNMPYVTAGETIAPRVAKLSSDMLQFAEPPRAVELLDNAGRPFTQADKETRFFEASWMHKYKGKYYFTYSTGDAHTICYAVGDNPYGPFTYQGVILTEVSGWTTHHSIVEFNGTWYLFYHDAGPSGGKNHLRSMKVTRLQHLPDGSIRQIDGKDQ